MRHELTALPPGSSFQALPITLTDNGLGKTAYGALPIAGDVTNVATAAGAFGQTDIIKLQALVMKYGAIAAGISNNYVKPVIKAFQDGAIDEAVAKGEEQLVQLDQGAQAIGQLLPEATAVIKLVDEAVDYAVPLFEDNVGNINQLIDLLSKASAMLDNLLPKLKNTIAIIQDQLLPALTRARSSRKPLRRSAHRSRTSLTDSGALKPKSSLLSTRLPDSCQSRTRPRSTTSPTTSASSTEMLNRVSATA